MAGGNGSRQTKIKTMEVDENFHGLVDAAEVLPLLRGRPTVKRYVERILGLEAANRIIGAACDDAKGDPLVFTESFLRHSGVTYSVDKTSSVSIPKKDGTLVLSNHPFGGADAMALLHYCLSARSDTKFFGNKMVQAIPPLRPCLLPLEIMTGEASHGNGMAVRRAVSYLRSGGLVVMFPAGAVSHFQWKSCAVEDVAWHSVLGAIVRLSCPQVLPVAFPGRNSLLFQGLGILHPEIRTAMLPREHVRLRGRSIQLVAGELIHDPSQSFRDMDDEEMSKVLRLLVDSLRGRRRMDCRFRPVG